jgi:hypothetical protein
MHEGVDLLIIPSKYVVGICELGRGTDFIQLVGTVPDICIENVFYPNKQV